MKLKPLLITGCSLLFAAAAITIIALCMKPSVAQRAAAGLANFKAAQTNYTAARYKPAESEARRTVKLYGQLAREVPKQKDFRVQLGHSQGLLSSILSKTDQPDKAEQVKIESVQTFQKAAADFPNDPYMRQERAFALGELGLLMESDGKVDEAEQSYRSCADAYEALKQEFPKHAWYLHEEGYDYWMLALMLSHIGRQQEAEAEFRQAIKLNEQGIHDFPNQMGFEGRLTAIQRDFANLLRTEGKSAEAEAMSK